MHYSTLSFVRNYDGMSESQKEQELFYLKNMYGEATIKEEMYAIKNMYNLSVKDENEKSNSLGAQKKKTKK